MGFRPLNKVVQKENLGITHEGIRQKARWQDSARHVPDGNHGGCGQADDRCCTSTTGRTIAQFSLKTESGIEVVYDVFDSNETLEAKLLAVKLRHRRTVERLLAKQIKAGVYQTLDKPKLPNWKNLNPDLLKAVSVSDRATSTLSAHVGLDRHRFQRRERSKATLGADAPVDSWDLIFKPENAAS